MREATSEEAMNLTQSVYVEGKVAASITIDFSPLFLSNDMAGHLLEKYAISLAGAIADRMNKDEEKGAE